jgi:hypothetical protein
MRLLISALIILLFAGNCKAQDETVDRSNYQPLKNRYFLRLEIDSLSQSIETFKVTNDSLVELIRDQEAKGDELKRINKQLSETNENLTLELEKTKGDQLQTSHTSSILLIFNIIAGIILLVTLIWIYNRKKPDENEEEVIPRVHNNRDHVEAKIDRIEKLGKLRDKGLLTEEEFLSQKRQILG